MSSQASIGVEPVFPEKDQAISYGPRTARGFAQVRFAFWIRATMANASLRLTRRIENRDAVIRVYDEVGNVIETLEQAAPVAEIFGSIADLMRTGLQNGWEECRYTKICPARWNTTKIRYVFSNSTTMLRLMRSVLLCLAVILITSCATITRGSHDKLTVLSEPSRANVVLSSGEKGVTPTTFVKSRRGDFTVTVSKAGYVPQTVNVESKVSATGGTAMAIGGPIGAGVDAVSGAYDSLYPNPVSVRLAPLRKSAAAAAIRRRVGASSTTKSSSQVNPSSSPSPLTSASAEPMFPTAKAVPGKPGYVFSPFDASGRYIDVSGYPSGSRAKDPWTDKIFIVP